MSRTYTTKEAAEELDVSDARVRQMIIDGSIEADRFGRSHVITQAAIEAAKKRKTAPGPVAKTAPKPAASATNGAKPRKVRAK